jgi:hypothetical protein
MQSGNMKRSFLAGAALLTATVSQAADVRPFIKAGADFGGDTLVTAVFTSGETQKIKANEGFYFGGGVSVRNEAKSLEGEVSIAYKFSMVDADNGDIDWTMMPVEALLFYRLPQWRLGGGLAYHVNPKLKGSGVVGGLNVSFDDALGVVLQADYLIGQGMAVGVRYTNVKYEVSGGGSSVKGGGIGGTFSYRF